MVIHFFTCMWYFIAVRFPHDYEGFIYPDEPRNGNIDIMFVDDPYSLYPTGVRLTQYVSALFFTTSYLTQYNSHVPQDGSQVNNFKILN